MLKPLLSTNNHTFGRVIWDKLPECISENFEIARVKRKQFEKSLGDSHKPNKHFALTVLWQIL